MRTLILFFATICMTSCAGDVHISYDASNDDVYYTTKDTTTTEKTVQRDTSDRPDYYDPETAQEVRWYELKSRGNEFDPFRYRYYIEYDQEGVGYKQRGCHIHEEYDHDDDYNSGGIDDNDDDDGRDRDYDISGNQRRR